MLDMLKTYANLILGGLALVAVLAGVITIKVYKHQRDDARAKLLTAQQTIIGYQLTMQAVKDHAAELVRMADEFGIDDAKEINDKIKASIPANDEEARQKAIAAGKVIGGLK